jgi:hypothetical protein
MFRFTIRELVLLTLVLSPNVATDAEDTQANRQLANSWWVVSDAYARGEPNRVAIGSVIVFLNGRIFFVDMDVDMVHVKSYDVAVAKSANDGRFEFTAGGRTVGKGLAIANADGKLQMFLNHSLRSASQIKDPETDKAKCVEMFSCLPLGESEGKERLRLRGVDLEKR